MTDVLVDIRRCGACGAEALVDVPLAEFPHFKDCPKTPCPTCKGRGYVQHSEYGGDSAKGTGWANYSQRRCPDCKPTEGTQNA